LRCDRISPGCSFAHLRANFIAKTPDCSDSSRQFPQKFSPSEKYHLHKFQLQKIGRKSSRSNREKIPYGTQVLQGVYRGGGLAEVLSHFRSMITCGANHLSPAGTGIPRWFNSSRATSSGQNQPLPSVKCLPCGKILRRLGLQKASAAPHIYCKPAGQPPNPRKFPSPVWQMCPGSPRSLR
jgi:hypothetical protein